MGFTCVSNTNAALAFGNKGKFIERDPLGVLIRDTRRVLSPGYTNDRRWSPCILRHRDAGLIYWDLDLVFPYQGGNLIKRQSLIPSCWPVVLDSRIQPVHCMKTYIHMDA